MRRLVVPVALVLAVSAAMLWRTWAGRTHEAPAARSTSDRRGPGGERDAGGASLVDTTGVRGEGRAAPECLLRGVVSGPSGILFGVRIVAYAAGTESVLAETSTKPDGAYSLAVDPGVAFDFAVEPMDQTGLVAARRDGLALAAGEERVEDFTLVLGATVRGRLVDQDGKGISAIGVLAVRPGAVTDLATRASVPKGLLAAFGKSGEDGWFRMRGLGAGAYDLAVADPEWMFSDPVSVRTDGPDLALTIVPALTIDLSVKDAETEEPVAAFSVRARTGEAIVEATGKDGAFSRRMRWPGAGVHRVLVEVSSPGFVSPEPFQSSGRPRPVWLVPVREPNTAVRVSFDDGSPYLGPLAVRFTRGPASGSVRFERDGDGVHRGALPRGRCDLLLVPEGVYGTPRLEANAEIAEGRDASLSLVLKAGGTLVFFPRPGAEWSDARIRSRDAPTRKVVRDDVEIVTIAVADAVLITVLREGTRVEGIPPGTYALGYDHDVLYEGKTIRVTEWFREINVVAGATEEIRLPAE